MTYEQAFLTVSGSFLTEYLEADFFELEETEQNDKIDELKIESLEGLTAAELYNIMSDIAAAFTCRRH